MFTVHFLLFISLLFIIYFTCFGNVNMCFPYVSHMFPANEALTLKLKGGEQRGQEERVEGSRGGEGRERRGEEGRGGEEERKHQCRQTEQ